METTRCKPATSFTTALHLYNTSADTLHLNLEAEANKYFRFLQGARVNIVLAPLDSVAIPLRLVNTWGRINGHYNLGVWLRAGDGRQQLLHVPVVLEGGIEPGVYAEVMQEKMLVLPGATTINLPVHIRSMLPDNTPLFIEQQPGVQALKLAGNPLPIQLPSVRDTTLSLSFLRERNAPAGNPAPIVLQVRDAAGKVWSTFNFLPQLLASSRSLYHPDPTPAGITSGVSFSSMGQGNFQQEYHLSFLPGTENAPLSAQLHYQEDLPYKIRRMQNTWVQYRNQNFHLVAGSQSGFHELNLQGRGLFATQGINGNKIKASAWLVDQNPNLLAPFSKGYNTERIASGQVEMQGSRGSQALVNGSWFNRQQNRSAGQLAFAQWQSAAAATHFFHFRVGLSREQFGLLDTTLHGWSGRMEWKHNGKKTQWLGLGQLATPTYAGQLRGQSQFTLQAAHTLSLRQALLLRLSAYRLQTAPGLVKIFGSNQFILTQSAEADYSIKWKEWTGQLRTYLLQQKQTLPLMLGQLQLASFSTRAALGLSGKAGKVFFNTLLDGGMQNPTIGAGKQKGHLTWKSNSSLSWRTFTLQASVQQGAYYITELQEQLYTGRPFGSLMFNASYACNLGKKGSLQGTLLTARNNVQQGWFQSGIVQGRWHIGGKWHTNAMLIYQGSTGLQASAGVQQTLTLKKRPPNSTRITLQVFEDKNGNGTREAQESVASGQVVQFDDILLITNGQGLLRINHMTKGRHEIRVLSKGSASKAMVTRTVDISGKDFLLVGIPPLHTVQGWVRANKDRYTGIAESVGGIKVVLGGTDGEQVTFTRADGFFSFEAPAGEYRVFLGQLKGSATTLYVHPQQGYAGKLELVWTAGERPVQVKKIKIQ